MTENEKLTEFPPNIYDILCNINEIYYTYGDAGNYGEISNKSLSYEAINVVPVENSCHDKLP